MISFQFDELSLSAIGSWPRLLRLVILAGGFLGLGYLGYTFDLELLQMQHQESRTKTQHKEAEFQHYQTKLTGLAEIRQEQIKLQETVGMLNEKLPYQPYEISFLEAVAKLSALRLVKITTLHPLEEELGGEFGAKAFELTLMGGFHNLSGFLESVRAFRIVTLENIMFKREKLESDILELKCIIKIYWLKFDPNNTSENKQMNEEFDGEEMATVINSLNSSLTLSQDPFQIELLNRCFEGSSFKQDACLKNLNRKKGALEWFPLESLRFVGTLKQNAQRFALIQDTQGILHRVEEGGAIGQNCGQVERIEEKLLEVREWIEGENKTWEESLITLSLS